MTKGIKKVLSLCCAVLLVSQVNMVFAEEMTDADFSNMPQQEIATRDLRPQPAPRTQSTFINMQINHLSPQSWSIPNPELTSIQSVPVSRVNNRAVIVMHTVNRTANIGLVQVSGSDIRPINVQARGNARAGIAFTDKFQFHVGTLNSFHGNVHGFIRNTSNSTITNSQIQFVAS
ncbi:MAG: hypothetical protein FWE05_08095 [Defluviitaleaceae bacterium]|nr:hypothetical protein [Defluviitaleaceae bacterium]